ncbi:MAG: hypothetical protein ABI310_08985 [Microbacteriaceae bacterium]
MADRFWRWYEKANAIVRTFTGPAQIGAGYTEAPDVRSGDYACPMCGKSMSVHIIERSTNQITPTRMSCPPAA